MKIRNLPSVLAGTITCWLLLLSCENFLDGTEIKKHVNDKIEYAALPSYNIEVSLPQNRATAATLNVTGNKGIKEGETFTIELRIDNAYSFEDFRVTDKATKEILTDALLFNILEIKENTVTSTITAAVTLKKPSSSLLVQPLLYRKSDIVAPSIGSFHAGRSLNDYNNHEYLENYRNFRFLGDNSEAASEGYKNHTSGTVFIGLEIFEEDSGIDHLEVGERKIMDSNDYTGNSWAERTYRWYNVESCNITSEDSLYTVQPFEYTIHEDDGGVELVIRVYDSAGLAGYCEFEQEVTVIKDTKCSTEFFLFNDPDLSTKEKAEEYGKRNADGSTEIDYTLRTDRDPYLNNADEIPEDMIFKYAVSQDFEELADLSPENMTPFISDYTNTNNFTIKEAVNKITVNIKDPSKSTYVRIYREDTVGNSAERFFYIPSVPQIFDARIIDTGTEKNLSISAGFGDKNLSPAAVSCAYKVTSLKRGNSSSSSWGTAEPAANSVITINLAKNSDSYYGSMNSAEFFIAGAVTDSDYHRLFGPLSIVSEAFFAQSTEAAPLLTFDRSCVTFAGEANSGIQLVTAVLKAEELRNFKSLHLKHPQKNTYGGYEYLYSPFENGKCSFEIPSEALFTGGLYLEILAVPENTANPFTKSLSITNNDIGLIDNIPPVWKTEFHYPHGNLHCTITDEGWGFDSTAGFIHVLNINGQEQDSNFNFEYFSDGNKSSDCSGNIFRYFDNNSVSINLVYEIKDKSGNKTNNEVPYDLGICFYGNEKYSFEKADSITKFTITCPSSGYKKENYPVSCDIITAESSAQALQNSYRYAWLGKERQTIPSTSDYGKTFTVKFNSGEEGFYRFFAGNKGPYYFWSEGRNTANIIDLIEGKNGIQIYSDVPFMVHTIWSRVNWSEKNLAGADEIDKWEATAVLGTQKDNNNAPVEGSTELKSIYITKDCSVTPYYYTIPLAENEVNYSINGKYYYTTIVHFADGSRLMTEVKNRN